MLRTARGKPFFPREINNGHRDVTVAMSLVWGEIAMNVEGS